MKLKLTCIKSATFKNGLIDEFSVNKGDVIRADINDNGVKLLNGNVWSLPFRVKNIEEVFVAE